MLRFSVYQLTDFIMATRICMIQQHPVAQVLSCFLLLFVLLLHIKSDSIVLGASLTGNETRISKGGKFALGFFSLINSNVKNWYVGIWFAIASPQTIVWVANSEQPLQNNSGVFNLTEDGSLLLSFRGSILWSTKGNMKKPSSAVIMDCGNLVVLISSNNSSDVIWQSFDHPGNTWLPGMKVSMSQAVTSWRSPWDPSPGRFSLRMDPKGSDQYVLLWKNQIKYWESGVWNGQIFSEIPEMTQNYIYDFNFFNNVSYKYFTISVKPNFTSSRSRFVVGEEGQVRVYIMLGNNKWSMFWAQPKDQCKVYAVCGAYGSCNNDNLQSCNCVTGFVPKDRHGWGSQQWSSACVRKTPLRCIHARNETTNDGFVELSGKCTPPAGVPYRGDEQCQAACLSNCSCTAYAFVANGSSQTCVMWFRELLDIYDIPNGISLFLRLDASDLTENYNANTKVSLAGIVCGVVVGLGAILAIVLLFVWWCRRPGLSATEYAPVALNLFSYRELQIATKNFSERLGGGGFGSVFKGTLPDSSVVAVKKLEGVNQGEKQFRMEVSTIGIMQHVNLVRLRGFCTEGSRRLLLYEYMPNGSLNSLLHKSQRDDDDEIEKKVLDWKTRFSIAVGTARAIVYLHDECSDCIIHCDIKPENILLDSNFCPKVADFGLAKLVGREYSKVLTTFRGTRGYLAPEWLSGLPITVKADVYSFGMTLLEIIAGRRNMDVDSESSDQVYFPAWAATQINGGNAMEVLDKKLMNNADAEEVKRAAIVAGWCIQDDEDDRPSMSQALQILEGIVDVPSPPPVPRSIQTFALKPESLVLFFWDKDISAHARNNNCDHPSNPL